MSSPLFFVIVLLVAGGGLLLVIPCRPFLRLLGLCGIVGGAGVLGGLYDLWPVVVVAAAAIVFYLSAFFSGRRIADDTSSAIPVSGGLRKAVAGVVAAGIAGLLLGVIWNTPTWKASRIPHGVSWDFTIPDLLTVLIPVVLGVLILSGRGQERGRG